MIPKFGLFSPYTLRFHSEYYNENSNAFLKRCLVIFENMTVIAPQKIDEGFVEKIIRNETNENVDRILSQFIPISEFVTEDYLTELSFHLRPESNMRYGPNHNEFVEFIKSFLTKKFGFDAYNVHSAHEFEILDFYVSALSSDFDFLFQISNKNSEISALYTELHKDAYFATFNGKTSSPERMLNKICTVNYFDFGKLSWNQILELKESHFISDFRLKFFEWMKEFNNDLDSDEFERKIDRYIKASNFEFLKVAKPNIKSDIVSGVLGNIPLPIPNPIAIYSSYNQIIKGIKTKNDFGWLFFIQEAFSKSNNN